MLGKIMPDVAQMDTDRYAAPDSFQQWRSGTIGKESEDNKEQCISSSTTVKDVITVKVKGIHPVQGASSSANTELQEAEKYELEYSTAIFWN